MTAPMPRCSCGCGERLTAGDYGEVIAAFVMDCADELTWMSSTCLTEHRKRLKKQKSVDGEAASVARGLVPAPRKKPDPKRGTCERCQQSRAIRRHPVGPDETLSLCRRCVP